MDHAQALWELESIKRLKSRYYRLQDENRWDEWAELFTEDSEVTDPLDPNVMQHGGKAIAARTAEVAEGTVRAHRGTMPDIELIDERTARGTWALYCASANVSREPIGHRNDIFGYYTDEYRKGDDGEWRIHRMHYHNDLALSDGTARLGSF
jgi:hypothetical protein